MVFAAVLLSDVGLANPVVDGSNTVHYSIQLEQNVVVLHFLGIKVDSIELSERLAKVTVQACAEGCLQNIYPVEPVDLTLDYDKPLTIFGRVVTLVGLTEAEAIVTVE